MLLAPQILRFLLLTCILVMAVLSVLYLRQRKMSTKAYFLWGLAAVFLPLLGPFLIIWLRPGQPDEPQ